MSATCYVASLNFGCCGIAVYRLMIIKYQHITRKFNGPHSLMWVVLSIQNLILVVSLYVYHKGVMASKRAVAIAFCLDETFTKSRIQATYELGYTKDDYDKGLLLQNLIACVCLLLSAIEVTIYGFIFFDSYLNNKAIVGLVSPDIIKKRNQSHVITLGGQALAFVGNVFVLLLVMAFLNVPAIHQYLEEASYVIILCFTGALTSIVDLYSSPEMRKFLVEKN